MGLAPKIKEYKDYELMMVGIHCKNRYEWVLLDLASCLYGMTLIPLYDTLGVESISYCLNNSGCTNMFASSESMDVLLST
jgi:long-chain acyl-CoA synthetase